MDSFALDFDEHRITSCSGMPTNGDQTVDVPKMKGAALISSSKSVTVSGGSFSKTISGSFNLSATVPGGDKLEVQLQCKVNNYEIPFAKSITWSDGSTTVESSPVTCSVTTDSCNYKRV